MSIPAKDDVIVGLVKPKGENESTVYNSAVIKGKIVSFDQGKDSTLIIAYCPSDKRKEFIEYVATNDNGDFMLYLPAGRRSLYQPWFFYYPSDIRLNSAMALLNEELP